MSDLPRLREWQVPVRSRRYVVRVGDVCVIARTKGSPHAKTGKGKWTLDRVTAVEPIAWTGYITAVESGRTPLYSTESGPPDKTVAYVISIPPISLDVALRQRDAWEAYIAAGRPEWRTRKEAQDWVMQYMAVKT